MNNVMVSNLSTDFYWYLITIADCERALNGESIHEMLTLICDIEKIKFVILNDVEGAGEFGLINSWQDKIDEILDIGKIKTEPKKLIQLDWCDFFLFKEFPNDWTNPKDWHYPTLIAQSDTTLRAVDDQYMYIYT